MLKALLKKQLAELSFTLIKSGKKGKQRSSGGFAAVIVAYIITFLALGMMFSGATVGMCMMLVPMGLDWLYFAVIGVLAVSIGVFGSAFTAYASIYQAKDNELLLAMPIPPSKILFVRLFGVWLWGFIFEAVVFIPSIISYAVLARFSILAIICQILLMLALSLLITAITCFLGWIIAKISSKLKNKSIITVIISLMFILIYYFAVMNFDGVIEYAISQLDSLAGTISTYLFPIYMMGRAGEGDIFGLLITIAICGAVFAIVYAVLSKGFIKLSTTNRGTAKKKCASRTEKHRGLASTLLSKEIKKFTSSATYMLNCGMASVMAIIVSIAALFNGPMLREILILIGGEAILAPIAAGIVCLAMSINDISAPSISLEGKNIWLLQSLPIAPWEVLKAKMKLHILFSSLPAAFSSIMFGIALRIGPADMLFVLIIPQIFVLFTAALGIVLNLKMPNLTWTNEIVPIKQSGAVGFSILLGFAAVIGLAAVFFGAFVLLGGFAGAAAPYIAMLVCLAAISALTAAMLRWIKKKGSEIFASL